jgi:hypothetical protein
LLLSHTLVVISESPPFVSKFSVDHDQWVSYPGVVTDLARFRTSQFAVYDDALVVFESTHRYCKVYDLVDDRPVAVGVSCGSALESLEGIWDSSIAVSSSGIAILRPDYESILAAEGPLIAALFRRRNGLFAATSLFIKKFTHITTVGELKVLIGAVAPSARSPTAQLRLTRAIQFSGTANPHFLLLALLDYARVLGPDMIALAKVPLVELLFHPACRHALEPSAPDCAVRLPIEILAAVIRAGLLVDWRCAEGPLDYVEVCIGAGRTAEARTVLLKARLDGEQDNERLTRLEAVLRG